MAVAQQEVEQAKVLAEQGKPEEAVALLSQLIQRDATNVGAWLALSDVVDDPERAQYCLQKVLNLDPGNATALEKLSKSRGGSLSVGAVGGLDQAELPIEDDPAPAQGSDDLDSDLMERLEAIPQAPADPPEQPEEVPAPEVIAEASSVDRMESEGSQDSEEQLEATPPAPEIPAETTVGDAPELDGAQGTEAQFAPAADAPEAIAQEPAKRSSVSRTDLILIGLTVLAGIVLCALVSAALIT